MINTGLGYKKKNRITTLFTRDEDIHKFPNGMVDKYINFENDKKVFSFMCYIYPDGLIQNRVQIYTHQFNKYVFDKFNEN